MQGVKEGEGVMKYSDGRIYFGNYKQNTRDGSGVLVARDFKYDGQWRFDKREGKGTLTDR
jgi:hypothetical protein